MEIELQNLKHLARDAHTTSTIIDEYCAENKDLFKEVINSETRYIRKIIYSEKRAITYWKTTTKPATIMRNQKVILLILQIINNAILKVDRIML